MCGRRLPKTVAQLDFNQDNRTPFAFFQLSTRVRPVDVRSAVTVRRRLLFSSTVPAKYECYQSGTAVETLCCSLLQHGRGVGVLQLRSGQGKSITLVAQLTQSSVKSSWIRAIPRTAACGYMNVSGGSIQKAFHNQFLMSYDFKEEIDFQKLIPEVCSLLKAHGIKEVRIVFDQADDAQETFKKLDLASLTTIGAAAQFSAIPVRCVIAVRPPSSKDTLLKLNGGKKVFVPIDNSEDGVFRVPVDHLRTYAQCFSSNLAEGPLWSDSVAKYPFFETVFHLAEAPERIGKNVEDVSSGAAPQTPQHWAQLLRSDEDPTQHSKAVAFQVTPAIANIDGLKDAVKAKVPEKLVGIASMDLKVYAHDATTGKWMDVPKASASLTSNTEETAYHVLNKTKKNNLFIFLLFSLVD